MIFHWKWQPPREISGPSFSRPLGKPLPLRILQLHHWRSFVWWQRSGWEGCHALGNPSILSRSYSRQRRCHWHTQPTSSHLHIPPQRPYPLCPGRGGDTTEGARHKSGSGEAKSTGDVGKAEKRVECLTDKGELHVGRWSWEGPRARLWKAIFPTVRSLVAIG